MMTETDVSLTHSLTHISSFWIGFSFLSAKPLSQSAIAGAVDDLTRRRNGYHYLIVEQVNSSPVVNPANRDYTNSLIVRVRVRLWLGFYAVGPKVHYIYSLGLRIVLGGEMQQGNGPF